MRELGLADTSPWGVVVKGGTEFTRGDGTLKKRQAALRALNAYFRKIDERKRAKRQAEPASEGPARGGKSLRTGGYAEGSGGDRGGGGAVEPDPKLRVQAGAVDGEQGWQREGPKATAVEGREVDKSAEPRKERDDSKAKGPVSPAVQPREKAPPRPSRGPGEEEEESREGRKSRRGRGGGVKGVSGEETRTVAQKVNVDELNKALETEQEDRTKAVIEAILARQRNGTLRVEYRRKKRGEGRWYATGRAQLQSCKRTVREAALRGLAWEVDLRASYPMIVLGLMRDMARTCGKAEQMEAIAAYVHETDKVRKQVAQDYRTSVKAAKQCFNLLMFGGSISKWKRVWKVPREAQSPIAEAFEKEMRRARVLIAEQELKRSGTRARKSDETLMSEAVSRAEEAIMLKIQQAVGKLGWETGTLIHDAIIVQRKDEQDPTEQKKLEQVVEMALFEAMEERGWTRGSARAKVTAM